MASPVTKTAAKPVASKTPATTYRIAYKIPGLEAELERADTRLIPVIRTAAEFLTERGQTLTVTCVFRTADVQAAYRAECQRLGRTDEPVKSPHEDGRGVDIRTRGIPRDAVKELVALLNKTHPYAPAGTSAARYPTALFHDVGQGEHIHIQVRPLAAKMAKVS